VTGSSARRWFVPEVVQTSAMDCGPAALKSLLEGFRVSVSYGRLREACQTDVDGTSIDALEDVACRMGLDAEQRVVPVDDLFLPEARALPGLLVVNLPSGLTHFVVAWRVHRLGGPFDDGGYVQLMDPGEGRRWVSIAAMRDELYQHALPVPAAAWRAHAATPNFLDPLRRRMRRLGVRAPEAWIAAALADEGWQPVAALDAAVRAVTAIAKAGGFDVGAQCEALFEAYVRAATAAPVVDGAVQCDELPTRFWAVHPIAAPGDDGEALLLLRGCVVMSVQGLTADGPAARLRAARDAGAPPSDAGLDALSPELAAALLEEPTPTWRTLTGLLRSDGALAPGVLAAAIVVASLAALGESLLFRSLFDVARMLGHGPQRLWGVAAVLVFLAALLALELPLALGLLRVGRHLENRLRVAFLDKLPRLGDRYFSSRPMFDLTDRSHSVQQLRALPPLAGALLRAVTGLAVTTVGIALVAPRVALPAVAAALFSVALPLAVQRPLGELDLRYRSHAGALGRFYLDALLGLTAVRTHGAERAIRREHESLLVEWARAARTLARASVGLEGLEAVAGMALSVSLLLGPFAEAVGSGSVLLLAYWALTIPALGAEVAQLARQYPDHRNVALRLLEPLGAREDQSAVEGGALHAAVSVRFENVTVRAGGHTVLDDVSVELAPAGHVAIVGSSGAGKSSLVGVLLGWHTPASGRVLLDGEPLEGERLATLRKHTVWVDPAVHLWNRSLLDNLRYGTRFGAGVDFGEVVRESDLRGVLERLPDGMQTSLGEGGALVSGGEGQRVRLGRGMLRPDARLVILDEPFRGLDRARRRELLARARARWSAATLLCITHDVGETLGFGRVLVIEGGRVIEDGDPAALAADPASRYRALLDAEAALRDGLWSSPAWRRLRLEGGQLREVERDEGGAP
jgi:ABC-type bacteriocin/lantibiotic exporter with double-glycine peptidase domain